MWRALLWLLAATMLPAGAAARDLLATAPAASDFVLAEGGAAANVVSDPADHAVVAIAAAHLREDIAAVSGAARTQTEHAGLDRHARA